MKIVMLCDFYQEELEYQENLLAKYYTKHGHKVVVVASQEVSIFDYYRDKRPQKKENSVLLYNGFKIYRLNFKWNILNRIKYFEGFSDVLLKEKPDVIYSHSIYPNLLDVVKYKKNNASCKLILDYHGDYSNSGKNWFSIRILHGFIRRRFFLKPILPFLDKIYPVVPASLHFLNKVYKIPINKMEILPLGVDVDLIKQVKADEGGNLVRKNLGITDDDFVIITGGKLTPLKKVELLIHAFLDLNKDNVYLLIIGAASKQEKQYQDKLEKLVGDNFRIKFCGWLGTEETYAHLVASNLAIFPASQSVLWQKSIGCGLPLIVGNTGGQSIEYLNQHKNIVILKELEIKSSRILEEINRLLINPEALDKMKNGAKAITDEMLDWNTLIQKTLSFK